MPFVACPRCDRHVRSDESNCPFCATKLGTTSAASLRLLGVALAGLVSCGDDTTTDDAAGTQGSDTAAVMTETGTQSTTEDFDAGGVEYAGPESSGDVWTTSGVDGSTSETGSTTDSSSDTGSDSGSSTGDDSTSGDTTDGGGVEYAGPPPDEG